MKTSITNFREVSIKCSECLFGGRIVNTGMLTLVNKGMFIDTGWSTLVSSIMFYGLPKWWCTGKTDISCPRDLAYNGAQLRAPLNLPIR